MLSRSRGAKLPLCISMHLAAFKECHPTPWSSSLSSAPRSCLPRFPHAPKSQERRAASRQFLPLLDSHIHHRATEAAILVVRTAASTYIFKSRPNSCIPSSISRSALVGSCRSSPNVKLVAAVAKGTSGLARHLNQPSLQCRPSKLEYFHLCLQVFSLASPSRCPQPWSPYPSQ
jgi:hypothetical protein